MAMKRVLARFFRRLADCLSRPEPKRDLAKAFPPALDMKIVTERFLAPEAVATPGPSEQVGRLYTPGWGPHRWEDSPIVLDPGDDGFYL